MNFIRFRSNSLRIENISALRLAKKYQTPFYCYSLAQLRNNFLRFNNIFKNIKPIICFSVKSNSNLTLLRELRKIGSGADVVSIGELLKAIKVGINSKKIVFSGVGKSEEEIKKAIKQRILLINIESESEAILINKVSKSLSKKTSVGIRLNPNIRVDTHKKISTGGKNEKFGLLYNDCINLCKKIKKMKNLKLEGLSVHIGSQIKDPERYKLAMSSCSEFMNSNLEKVEGEAVFNAGGGFFSPYAGEEVDHELTVYSQSIHDGIKEHWREGYKIMIEPGRALVNNPGVILYTAGAIKADRGDKPYILVDGGMSDNPRPALYGSEHKLFNISAILCILSTVPSNVFTRASA